MILFTVGGKALIRARNFKAPIGFVYFEIRQQHDPQTGMERFQEGNINLNGHASFRFGRKKTGCFSAPLKHQTSNGHALGSLDCWQGIGA